MPKREIVYYEEHVDENGVLWQIGYSMEGLRYNLNINEVVRRYEELGIDRFRRSVWHGIREGG